MYHWVLYGIAVVVLEGISMMMISPADSDKLLTREQLSNYDKKGLHLFGHGGWWGCVFLLNPFVVAPAVAIYSSSWTPVEIGISAAIGIIASVFMHWTYTKTTFATVFARPGVLTPAGKIDRVHMAIVIAVAILLFAFTPGASTAFLEFAAAAFVIFLIMGTNVLLAIPQRSWFPDRPLKNPATYVIILGSAALFFIRIHYF